MKMFECWFFNSQGGMQLLSSDVRGNLLAVFNLKE